MGSSNGALGTTTLEFKGGIYEDSHENPSLFLLPVPSHSLATKIKPDENQVFQRPL